MNLRFYKYHGAGNDFIILDNRTRLYDAAKKTDLIAGMCHRRFGIGADGLMMIESEPGYDFKMVYFNADGQPGSMCGNGGRCIVALAHHLGIVHQHTRFIAADGPHDADVLDAHTIALKMQDVHMMDVFEDHIVLDTGSPHYILKVKDLYQYPVYAEGKRIRYSPEFPQGLNVNFVELIEKNWHIRTYERGVEDETWACGTGATAAALALVESEKYYAINELVLKAKGGDLLIKFNRKGPGIYDMIWLCGGAVQVFEGTYQI